MFARVCVGGSKVVTRDASAMQCCANRSYASASSPCESSASTYSRTNGKNSKAALVVAENTQQVLFDEEHFEHSQRSDESGCAVVGDDPACATRAVNAPRRIAGRANARLASGGRSAMLQPIASRIVWCLVVVGAPSRSSILRDVRRVEHTVEPPATVSSEGAPYPSSSGERHASQGIERVPRVRPFSAVSVKAATAAAESTSICTAASWPSGPRATSFSPGMRKAAWLVTMACSGRRGRKQFGQERGGAGDVFEVIENEQGTFARDCSRDPRRDRTSIPCAESGSDLGRYERSADGNAASSTTPARSKAPSTSCTTR